MMHCAVCDTCKNLWVSSSRVTVGSTLAQSNQYLFFSENVYDPFTQSDNETKRMYKISARARGLCFDLFHLACEANYPFLPERVTREERRSYHVWFDVVWCDEWCDAVWWVMWCDVMWWWNSLFRGAHRAERFSTEFAKTATRHAHYLLTKAAHFLFFIRQRVALTYLAVVDIVVVVSLVVTRKHQKFQSLRYVGFGGKMQDSETRSEGQEIKIWKIINLRDQEAAGDAPSLLLFLVCCYRPRPVFSSRFPPFFLRW